MAHTLMKCIAPRDSAGFGTFQLIAARRSVMGESRQRLSRQRAEGAHGLPRRDRLGSDVFPHMPDHCSAPLRSSPAQTLDVDFDTPEGDAATRSPSDKRARGARSRQDARVQAWQL